jgi:NAD(P)H-hydrate epimerase
MIPVCTREEVRDFDARAIATMKIPSVLLMENAGRGAADFICELWAKERDAKEHGAARVVIACGTGNNGGDGFVVARHLLLRGFHVVCYEFGKEASLTPDARTNRDAFASVDGQIVAGTPHSAAEAFGNADIIVDALFGTGLTRPIEGELAQTIEAMNEATALTVALDLPSGLDANTGEPLGATVVADATATFAFHKQGLLTPNGRKFSGETRVCDIGVPPALGRSARAEAVESHDVRALLTARALDAHKYSAGHVAVLGGREGKLGASLLASHAAIRAGAGAATIVTWPDAARALSSRVLEVMTAPIDGGDDRARAHSVDASLKNKAAAVIGPGFGTDAHARAVVEHVVATSRCPLVVDADAIGAYAQRPEALSVGSGRVVLTPHAGELARLLGVTSRDVEADRYATVRRAAAITKCVVLLKGASTLVADPDGDVVVNTTGGPSLATAGSGDVLSGIIAALACSLPPFEAAWAGAFLHGAAGDAWSRAHGDRGLVAHEIADAVPDVVRALRG